jgi:hypothetical protein
MWWWRRSSSTRCSSPPRKTSMRIPRDLAGTSRGRARGRRPAVRAVGRGDVPRGGGAHGDHRRGGVRAARGARPGRPTSRAWRPVVAKLFAIVGPCTGVLRREGLPAGSRWSARWCATCRSPSTWSPAPRSASPTGSPCRAATRTSRPRSERPAPSVHTTLQAGRAAIDAGERDPAKVRDLMAELIAARAAGRARLRRGGRRPHAPGGRSAVGELRLLAAVRFGKARLIDNLGVRDLSRGLAGPAGGAN